MKICLTASCYNVRFRPTFGRRLIRLARALTKYLINVCFRATPLLCHP